MYNWSTDEKQIKDHKEKFAVWKIEQMVNFGLGGKRIKEKDIRKYFSKINIDPSRRKFLKALIYSQRQEICF